MSREGRNKYVAIYPFDNIFSKDLVPLESGPLETLGVDVVVKQSWTILTNHGHVLLLLYRNGDLRQRDIARLVGITEGAAQRILSELDETGYIDVERVGRRNHYRVNVSLDLRHPVEAGHCIGEILERLAPIGEETNGSIAQNSTDESLVEQEDHAA